MESSRLGLIKKILMKLYFRLFPFLFLLVTFETIHAQKTYTLLSKQTGKLN